MFEYLNLNFGLGVEFGLIPYYFEGYMLLLFVIEGLENLAEGTPAQELNDLVPIDDGIGCSDSHITILISKFFEGLYPPFAQIKDFVPVNFLPL